jgi:hypothetical protein
VKQYGSSTEDGMSLNPNLFRSIVRVEKSATTIGGILRIHHNPLFFGLGGGIYRLGYFAEVTFNYGGLNTRLLNYAKSPVGLSTRFGLGGGVAFGLDLHTLPGSGYSRLPVGHFHIVQPGVWKGTNHYSITKFTMDATQELFRPGYNPSWQSTVRAAKIK